MANDQGARVKLINTHYNLKFAVKNNVGKILRINKKNFEDEVEKLPHELLITTRQLTKIGIVFTSNVSTYKNISKAQISKIIQ